MSTRKRAWRQSKTGHAWRPLDGKRDLNESIILSIFFAMQACPVGAGEISMPGDFVD
jgi:hypothetical protein